MQRDLPLLKKPANFLDGFSLLAVVVNFQLFILGEIRISMHSMLVDV